MPFWGLFLAIVFAVFVFFEVRRWLKGKSTLSQEVIRWTAKWPPLSFAIGVAVGMVAGHWWW